MIRRAKTMTKPEPGPQEDPWYYGWRYVEQTGPEGEVKMIQVPLTEEDVLHPQEDDFIVQNPAHEEDCHYLKTILAAHLAEQAGVEVFRDMRLDWGVADIEPHGPDIAVIANVPGERPPQLGTLHLAEVGASPLLVIEVTSPTTRRWDLNEKVTEYYRAGIPYYAIVDRQFQGGEQPRLFAYLPGDQEYVLVEPDVEGWLALGSIDLWLKFEDGRLVCRDAGGRRFRDYREVMEEGQQAEERAEAERTRAEAEVQARQRAEERIRQLEAELNRLRGQS